MSYQHLVKHDSHCPYIALLGVLVVLVGLGGHVLGRTYIVEYLGFVRDLLHRAVAEVDDCDGLAVLPFEEDIVWFEVAMDDLLAFYPLVPLEDLPKDVHGLVDGQSLWMFLDVLGEGSSLKELQHQVHRILIHDNVD